MCRSEKDPVQYQLEEKPGWAECTQCLERCAPEEDTCHICGSELRYLGAQGDETLGLYQLEDDDPAAILEATLAQEWCLTCDQGEAHCRCPFDESLPLAEALDTVWELGIDVYDPSGMCDTCVLAFTAQCEPFKSWMVNWHDAVNEDQAPKNELITGCENYRSV